MSACCCNFRIQAITLPGSGSSINLELLEEAKIRVKARVAPHTWRAFELIEQSALPIEQIASEVGMQVAMVYVARSKVKRMLKEELAELEN